MADPKTSQSVIDKITILKDRYTSKDIGLDEYAAELMKLQKLLTYYQDVETLPQRDTGAEEEAFASQALEERKKLETEYAKLESNALTMAERFEIANKKIQQNLEGSKATTSEFIDKMPAEVGVSNVRDAQRGLIRDPDTGILRKGTRWELFKEIPYKQVYQTGASSRDLKAERANKYTQMYKEMKKNKPYSTRARLKRNIQKQRDLEEGLYPIPDDPEEYTERLDNLLIPELKDFIEKPGRETVNVVEAPLATALRWLNVPSALTATYLQDVNDTIGMLTGAPVSTRDDGGYKSPKGRFKYELGSQFLSNALLGQGIITQQQAQLNPPDEDYDGLFNIATQGSTGSLGLGLMAEFGDLLPLDAAAAAKALTSAGLKSIKNVAVQKAGMFVDSPLEAYRYAGSKAEIKAAVDAIDKGMTVKDLEKQIVNNGGVLSRNSLRKKAGEAIGDVIGGYKAIKKYIEEWNIPAGKTKITSADINVPQSSFVKNFFGKDDSLTVLDTRTKIANLEAKLASVSPKGANRVTALNRVQKIADDTVEFILNNTKPIRESRQVKRGVNTALLTETKAWDDILKQGKIADSTNTSLKNSFKRGRVLTLQSSRKALTMAEIIELGNAWKKVTATSKVSDELLKSPSTIYQSVRNNVSDILQDNFLKNIPDDYIYVTKDVAVPYKNVKGDLLKKYQTEIQTYLPEGGILSQEKVKRVLQLTEQTGNKLSAPLLNKLQAVEAGDLVKLTTKEIKEIQEIASSTLALDFMGGVRLNQGTQTSKMASLYDTGRESLINVEQGKSSSFKIQTQGLINATRLIVEGNPIIKKVFNVLPQPFNKWGKGTGQLSPAMMRFSDEVQAQSTIALTQVEKNLTRNLDPKNPTQSFNDNLEYYNQMSINNKKTELETTKIRSDPSIAEVDPMARKEFVGEINFEPLYDPITKKRTQSNKQEDKIISRESLRLQEEFEKKVNRAEHTLHNVFKKEIKRINKGTFLNVDSAKVIYENLNKMYRETRNMLWEAFDAERSIMYDAVGDIFDSPKLKALEAKTTKKIDQLHESIKQHIQKLEKANVEKSTSASRNRRLQAVSDKYGRDNVEAFMKEQNIGTTYDDLMENIEFLENNMNVAIDQITRMDTWKSVVGRFFTSNEGTKTKGKVPLKNKWIDQIESLVRINPQAPYWIPNNIRPLTIQDFVDVIKELRVGDESLKNYGLSSLRLPFIKTEELYTLPLIEHMVKTQRTNNMSRAINDFVKDEPDIFINMDRNLHGTIGLDETKNLADSLTYQIKETLDNPVLHGFLSHEAVNTLVHQIRETLFDGMMKDVWQGSGRIVQEKFINTYLRKMVHDNTTSVNNMDEFLSSMYQDTSGQGALLTSNTFKNVEKKVDKVLEELANNLPDLKLAPGDESFKILESLETKLADITNAMKTEYINVLLTRTSSFGGDSLFGTQINNLNDYMSRFGIDPILAMKKIRELSPRFEYLGTKNLGLIHGDLEAGNITKILELSKTAGADSLMNSVIQQAANRKNYGSVGLFLKDYLGSTLNAGRRWANATMLGGAGLTLPSMRFYGINRLTAPIIFMSTLGKDLNVSTMAKATALSLTMGALSPIAKRLPEKMKPLFSDIKSNRYMYAPDDEIILSTADGAIRDFTAKELRDITQEQGILYSQVDALFHDTQFTKLLIDTKLTAEGKSRYLVGENTLPASVKKKILDNMLPGINKVLDNTLPGRKSVFNELAKYQDTEIKRFFFIDSLRKGESIKQAVSKAKRSMLDYSSLTDIEKKVALKGIYFYSFMRTMGASTINSVYRSIKAGKMSPALRAMSQIDKYYRQIDEDYSSWNSLDRSRLWQIYTGSVDNQKQYVGGPPNPMTQGFEFMAMASLYMLDTVATDTSSSGFNANIESALWSILKTATVEGNPFVDMGVQMLGSADKFANKRPIPFPSELQYAAEQQGYLPELIKTYGLVKRPRTPGRPLTSEGDYYDFPLTIEGKKSYKNYLWQRMIGLTVFAQAAHQAGWTATQTRGMKDYWRSRMLAEEDMSVPSPTGEGELRIPTRTRFLKTLGSNQMDASMWYYLTGLLTPNKARSLEETRAYGIKNQIRDLENAQKRLGSD